MLGFGYQCDIDNLIRCLHESCSGRMIIDISKSRVTCLRKAGGIPSIAKDGSWTKDVVLVSFHT